MNILVLGGTVFLGRHVVAAAAAAGHTVTTFNRGKSGPDLHAEHERLTGDRDGGLDALAGRDWDAVIDCCGYVPRVVAQSVDALRDRVGHYTFVSSGSVYPHPVPPGTDESGAVGTLDDPSVEEVTGETYGPLKALCEDVVTAAYGDRGLIVRSGLIVGPHDPSDRFTYWPVRISRGGRVLAPLRPELPVQFVDARDQAEWIVRMLEGETGGTFNVTGPASPLTLGQVHSACVAVTGSDAEFVWADAAFLDEHEVSLWGDMPLAVGDEALGFMQIDVRKALDAGLTFRPLDVTIRETLDWASARPADAPSQAGLTPDREQELLALVD